MKAVRLRLRPPEGSFPGVDAALATTEGIDREALVHFEWLGNGSYSMLYRLGVDPGTELDAVLASTDEVIDYDFVASGDREQYCYVHVEERELLSDLLAIADAHALVLERPIRFVDGDAVLTIVGDASAIQEAYRDATGTIDVSVEWSGGYEPGEPDAIGRLTARQREAVRTAYDLGFYETPRRTSYEEIADELDCAPSTANELLRRAEAAIVAATLDG
ncbi:helix-turn-helix domain-containing protein [Halosolutus amylolyticus]|uniref:Helix-turn-helix domain-containing protein n=1 Tax=Halosolutus amylolyticus TaxID=2932267 RepID=A0ABD5PT79_9EURY|nr:helix-turn-helix domain-containing protein [Halosolutus amylolyticus]